MKVLIAYDGSESADTAIDGLRRAGLPIRAFLVGSVSAAVAARAACSVEVVRLRNGSL
jgi:nucleotide-binding universal stress UspA family protein